MTRTLEQEKQILERAYKHFKSLYLPRTRLMDYCMENYDRQTVVNVIIEKHATREGARPKRGFFRIPPEMLENSKLYEEFDRNFERENKITEYGGAMEPDSSSEEHYVSRVLQNLDAVELGLTNPKTKVGVRDSAKKRLEIDLLCEGADGRSIVIELKRVGQTPRDIAAQTIEYMGMIMEERNCKDCVRGYMLVGERYPAVNMAERVVANLKVKLYRDVFPPAPRAAG